MVGWYPVDTLDPRASRHQSHPRSELVGSTASLAVTLSGPAGTELNEEEYKVYRVAIIDSEVYKCYGSAYSCSYCMCYYYLKLVPLKSSQDIQHQIIPQLPLELTIAK